MIIMVNVSEEWPYIAAGHEVRKKGFQLQGIVD